MTRATAARDSDRYIRETLRGELAHQQQLVDEYTAALAEPADAEGSPDDRALASWSLQRALDALAEVESALARLELGTLGRCDVCGHDISAARLEALPTTTRCIMCAAL